jgi:50S ribosomal subunit-associated GTPase HflX
VLNVERKVSYCLDTIKQIGAGSVPILAAMNKIDLVSEDQLKKRIKYLRDLVPNQIPISALYETNIDLLEERIAGFFEDNVRSSIVLPMSIDSMPLLSWVFDNANVHNVNYESETMKVSFGSSPKFAEKARKRVEKLGGTFNRG